MRTLFIMMRSMAYIAMFVFLWKNHAETSWLTWSLSIIIGAWNSWDQWKRPNDPVKRMRSGVWLESALIVVWALFLQDGIIFFMLISPLMRACIHLSLLDDLIIYVTHLFAVYILSDDLMPSKLWFYSVIGVLTGIGIYSLILGLLLKERDLARRHLAVTAFEREQYSKEQERMRIAGQLHDMTGQYWTSIVRALDAALVTPAEQSRDFIVKAQDTARQGLQEMRMAVHDWQDGRQTPHQWMDYLQASAVRFRELTDTLVRLQINHLDWNRIDDPTTTAQLIARIGIEAMTNAVRHGKAQEIQLILLGSDEGIEMIVKDDGLGMDVHVHANGTGVASMKSQVDSLRGKWELLSEKGKGTSIKLSIPFRSQGVNAL